MLPSHHHSTPKTRWPRILHNSQQFIHKRHYTRRSEGLRGLSILQAGHDGRILGRVRRGVKLNDERVIPCVGHPVLEVCDVGVGLARGERGCALHGGTLDGRGGGRGAALAIEVAARHGESWEVFEEERGGWVRGACRGG